MAEWNRGYSVDSLCGDRQTIALPNLPIRRGRYVHHARFLGATSRHKPPTDGHQESQTPGSRNKEIFWHFDEPESARIAAKAISLLTNEIAKVSRVDQLPEQVKVMNEQVLKLPNAPIVEAVIDIDCDMPPTLDLKALEEQARERLQDVYPKFNTRFVQEHRFEKKGEAPPELSSRHGIEALQLLQEDEKQLVQIHRQGFSFNRLAPYSSLDDYLPEIERTWKVFHELTLPVQVRVIRLRYINRFHLPPGGGEVDLEDYLKITTRFPDEENLIFTNFLNQYSAKEIETGNDASIVLTSQTLENEGLPIIFDITAAKAEPAEPEDWALILSKIQSLRNLKNRIFLDTLTKKCLELFQ